MPTLAQINEHRRVMNGIGLDHWGAPKDFDIFKEGIDMITKEQSEKAKLAIVESFTKDIKTPKPCN